jgi:hypothetical protein
VRRRAKIILATVIVIPLTLVAGFLIWAYTPLGPMPEALSALLSDENVVVSIDTWIVFQPLNMTKATGFIIYPGARIDPRSYAPIAYTLAEGGFIVVIVPMPLNLAVFGSDLANDVIRAYPSVESWAIGGHSLGGSMAATFVHKHPTVVKGIALWASYPSAADNLSGLTINATSIFGTLDGLTSLADINASRSVLPPNTVFVEIVGGNHAQFGWYGPQSGDNLATITRESQQEQIVEATLALLRSLGS